MDSNSDPISRQDKRKFNESITEIWRIRRHCDIVRKLHMKWANEINTLNIVLYRYWEMNVVPYIA